MKTVTRELTEIRDQKHLMDAHGTADEKPIPDDIVQLIASERYHANDIDVWFDDMMGFWRWTCNISPIKDPIQ